MIHMIMLEFTRRRPKDGMTKESPKESLELEKLSCCITQAQIISRKIEIKME